MRVAAYYRVSSAAQRERDTIAGQRAEVRRLVTARGWELVAECEDDGRSARTGLDRRTGFAELLRLAGAGRLDAVVCVAFDRLTRAEDLEEQGAILGTLQRAGVRLVTGAGDETDLSTFGGRMTALLRGQLAAEESAEKSRRARRGRRRAAAEGRNPGRQPYGYRHAGGAWTAPEGPVVMRIYSEAAAGASCSAIAAGLNREGLRPPGRRSSAWTDSAVRDLVVRRARAGDPYVTGLWLAHPEEPAVQLPALVPAELAAAARAAVTGRAHSPPIQHHHVNLLDCRAARCGICGAWIRLAQSRGRLRADGTRARFAYYACERRLLARVHGGEVCALPIWRVEVLDQAVWAAVLALAERLAPRAAAQGARQGSQVAADAADARARLGREQARLEALAEALGGGALTAEAYRAQVARVQARRDQAARDLATWEGAEKPAEVGAEAVARLRWRIAEAARAGDGARRELLRELWPQWVVREDGAEVMRGGGAVGEPMAAPLRIVLARPR